MKLKKLVISGFGPYAQTQELDFEYHLGDRTMFVISGNTGAGKTTIFDAINFALFGNASGSERDGKSLRSDFATPETDTWVELYFSLREKDYYVKRSPQYERPKKRGEGTTKTSASAEMKFLTDDKIITGYSEVTGEVENILGINSSQFKQLVMIPQGEFKRLLSADSKEKEAIFRKIFGTEAFEKIQKSIVDRSNTLKRTIEDASLSKKSIIKRFRPSSEDEELSKLMSTEMPATEPLLRSFNSHLDADKKSRDLLDKRLEDIKNQYDSIAAEIIKGEEINKKLLELEKNNQAYQELLSMTEENDKQNAQITLAKKAQDVWPFEEKWLEKKTRFGKSSDELNLCEEKATGLFASLKSAEENLKTQKERQNEKQILLKNLDKLAKLKEKTADYEEKKASSTKLKSQLKASDEALSQIVLTMKSNAQNIIECDKKLENIAEMNVENLRHGAQLSTYRESAKKAMQLTKSIEQYSKTLSDHSKKALDYKKADEKFKELQKDYESKEDAFRRNQAGLLAASLIDGGTCPVCGSLDHPSPAALESADISEESLKLAKTLCDEHRVKRDSAYEVAKELMNDLNSAKKNSILPLLEELLDIGDFESIDEIFIPASNFKDEIVKKGKDLKTVIDANAKIIEEGGKIKKLKEDAETGNKKLETDKEELLLKKSKDEIRLSAIEENLSSTEKEFEGNIRSGSELETEEKQVNAKITEMEDLMRTAEEFFTAAKAKLDTENGKILAIKAEIKSLEVEINDTYIGFLDALKTADFADMDVYRSNLVEKTEINRLEKLVQEFKENLRFAESAYKKSLEETEGLKKTDLDDVKLKQLEIKDIQTDTENKIKDVHSRVENNKDVIKELERESQKLLKLEAEYRTVGDLAKVIKGDNSSRMSFERYVLASYYEDIIAAANLRFSRMSLGRFELCRKQEVGDARKGSGLDLEVFDNYTGKARDVKTLSGGESFKASLSMALGLADIVQSHAGGIQLDTMFIDEGFGTLDPESLDKAIEALVELQSDGRMVGIISHVPELKERIEARLEVSTTASGSRAEFIVN
ncbi:AAA family ATPase [Proteocatella sphenisci]|uniref:AAA family ATPase n=1 Tax=Proteocatella sphenisci TaxID=181070 RepID=UPI00048B5D88|nr:SMC family ATPase [Proteocatella sphenisci]